MKNIPISDFKKNLDINIQKASKDPVIITKNGRPIRDRNAIEYREDLDKLKSDLARKLETITMSAK